jgi:SAM-dependent methyltransferase
VTAGGSFKDHFSDQSAAYAQHRPTYPDDLFQFLADQCDKHALALDCATGNGQAAIGLASHFDRVVATDASAAQVAAAIPNDGVEYRVARAEDNGLPDHSVDLLAVGQALHWFDFGLFFAEAERTIRPGGLLATWCYGLCLVSEDIDRVVDRLYAEIVEDFWPPERRIVENAYADIRYPAELLTVPDFYMRARWSIDDMLGYLGTWSACKRYAAHHGQDPVAVIEAQLRDAWSDGGSVQCEVVWPVQVRACKLPN